MYQIIKEVQRVTVYIQTDGYLHKYTAVTSAHRTTNAVQDFDLFFPSSSNSSLIIPLKSRSVRGCLENVRFFSRPQRKKSQSVRLQDRACYSIVPRQNPVLHMPFCGHPCHCCIDNDGHQLNTNSDLLYLINNSLFNSLSVCHNFFVV